MTGRRLTQFWAGQETRLPPPFAFPLLAVACVALTFAISAADAPDTKSNPYPLWDGQESIADYAQRVNLPPTKTLDLGNGVNLDLVLIPAGKFVMGTPEPKEDAFTGQMILVLAGAAAFALVVIIVIRSIHKHRRPQFSLRWLLVFVIMVGFAMLGGFRWRAVAKAWTKYEAAQSHDSDEWPAHEVTLTRPFYIGKFEVTQAQYQQVMGTNPSQFKGADLPVDTVSWGDATEFGKKVSENNGQAVRLPTEAEWEYACRAGTCTSYSSGDEDTDLGRAAWYTANSMNTTHPVGQKDPNAWDVFDMHGNVWEWCRDWHEYYKPKATVDPQGPPEGEARVVRGGSWNHSSKYCRSAYHRRAYPFDRGSIIGFRVVVEAPPRTP
jgi:formylglycine-generating enzyme required for sulfatase activity